MRFPRLSSALYFSMIDPIEILYMPIQPFIWHPERAFLVAIIFFVMLSVMFLRKKKNKKVMLWPTMAAIVIWCIFGVNEYFAKINQWDIRVDLLILMPLVLFVSLFSIFTWYLAFIRKFNRNKI